ncbi:cysteine hydrolase [Candidatus Woesearchaeota archaeon]|nr:cysteine hydrolase [Candidatus Woesearchaeota archaeon]
MENRKIDFEKVAVLVVDIQNDFCDNEGIFAQQGLNVKPAQIITPKIEEFIKKIRRYDLLVIYTKQIEHEDITPQNLKRQFNAGKLKPVCSPNSWGSELYKLKPLKNEFIIEKYTYDVFSNPKLHGILNENKIKTIVVIGVNTDICVDTTVRSAFTKGYQIVVLKDLVATMNKQSERYYLDIFNRFFGDVMHSKKFISFLSKMEV